MPVVDACFIADLIYRPFGKCLVQVAIGQAVFRQINIDVLDVGFLHIFLLSAGLNVIDRQSYSTTPGIA